MWQRVRTRDKPGFKICKRLLRGKTGLEIGGPSSIFSPAGFLPIYPLVHRLDNCNFSRKTVWEGDLGEGLHFRFDEAHGPGYQYIREATELRGIPSGSCDFVLSSHTLEHIANPLRALREWLRVLKDHGVLVLVVPHKDRTFDHRRPVTSLAHLVEDYARGCNESDLTHLPEILALHDLERDPWAGGVENFRQRSLCNFENRCLHHHVFDAESVLLLMDHVGLQIRAVECESPYHIAAIGQKLPAGKAPDNRAFFSKKARSRYQNPFALDRAA